MYQKNLLVSEVNERYRNEFLKLLNEVQGEKTLVWDEPLTKSFGTIADYTLLKQNAVTNMYSIEGFGKLSKTSKRSCPNLIFICRAYPAIVQRIVNSIAGLALRIIFVPRKCPICEMIIRKQYQSRSQSKLKQNVNESETIDIKCFELFSNCWSSDLITMNDLSFFTDVFVYGNKMKLEFVTSAIKQWETMSSIRFYNISAYGAMSKEVANDLVAVSEKSDELSTVDIPFNLVLVDRSLDYISLLLTDFTYEGLIDRFLGIINGYIELPADYLKEEKEGNFPEKIDITGFKDDLYSCIRLMNFAKVPHQLTVRANELRVIHDETERASNIQDVREVVKKIPKYKNDKMMLSIHTYLAEHLDGCMKTHSFIDMIDCERDIFNRAKDRFMLTYLEANLEDKLVDTLRLLCILCGKEGFQSVRHHLTNFCQTFGAHYALTIRTLEKAGLLKLFPKHSKPLHNDDDVPYSSVFSGQYEPLVVQMISGRFAADFTWSHSESITNSAADRASTISSTTNSQLPTMVYFVGGATFAEIQALRQVSQNNKTGTEIVIGCTSVVSFKKIIDDIIERPY